MIIHNVDQNSAEWLELRKGKFTASSCADLLMDEKNKGYQNLIKRIAFERFTNKLAESWQGNQYTDRGKELEDEAREDYSFVTNNTVETVGFIEIDNWIGFSPDGTIGEDGLVQLKCPIYSTQMDYLEKYEVPGNYYKQMQFEMLGGRKWNDFYSYHPDLPHVLIRVERDEEMIKQINLKITLAKQEVKRLIKKLKDLK